MASPLARRGMKRHLALTLLINAVAPYLIYVVAKQHTGELHALVCASIPPAVESLWSVLHRRRIDVMAVLVLSGIGAGAVLMALGGSARLLLLRESLITGLVGLVFILSLAYRRPLIFYLAREMQAGDNPTAVAQWNARWQYAAFRVSLRTLTLVWGAGLVLECGIRIQMVRNMAIAHFLVVSPFVQYGLTAALVGWSVWYARRRRRRFAKTPSASILLLEQTLMSDAATELTDADFERTLQTAERPVVVEFYAPGCSYCERMAPLLTAAHERYGSRAQFVRIDVQANATRPQYGLSGTPTLAVYDGGRERATKTGAMRKQQLDSFLNHYL